MAPALEVLKNLCQLLDSSYEEALVFLGLEAHDEPDKLALGRINAMVRILDDLKEERYSKLKVTGKELLKLWKHVEVTPDRFLNCKEAIACVDTNVSTEIVEANYLSLSAVKRAHTELNEVESYLRRRYESQKEKILILLKKSHLQMDQFTSNHQGEAVDYGDAIIKLKEQIKAVKAQTLRRKDIVVRMEILQQSLCDRGFLHNLKGFIKKTRKLVDDFQGNFLYDGQLIRDIIDKIDDEVKGNAECHINKFPTKKCLSASVVELEGMESNGDKKEKGLLTPSVELVGTNSSADKKESPKIEPEVGKVKMAITELALLGMPTPDVVASSQTRLGKSALLKCASVSSVEHDNMNSNADNNEARNKDPRFEQRKKFSRELAALDMPLSTQNVAALSRTRSGKSARALDVHKKSEAPFDIVSFLPPHPKFPRTPRTTVEV